MDELKTILSFYLKAFWRRRWRVVVSAWIVCIVGWLGVAMIPNLYTATAKLYVDTESVIDPLMRGLAVTPDIDRQIEVMRQTLLSRPNVEQIIQRADLDHLLDNPASVFQVETLIEQLAEDINVRAEARNLYQVSYTSADSVQAYRIVDAVLEIFVEQNVGVTQRDVDTARGFIDRQITEYEVKLRDAELSVAKFRQEHAAELGGMERAQRQLEATEARLQSLRSDRDSAVWNRDQFQSQLANVPRRLPATQITGRVNPQQSRLETLIETRERLRLVYTDLHPDIQSINAQIEQAEQELSTTDADGNSRSNTTVPNPLFVRLEQQHREAEARVRDYDKQIQLMENNLDELVLNVAQTPQVEADLTRLTRDYEVLFNNYQELIQRRESAQFAQRLDSETDRIEFRIVEPPYVPLAPSGPPHALLMAAVLFGGIGAGLALGFTSIVLSNSAQTAGQLKERFGLPVLGAIGEIPSTFARCIRFFETTSLCAFFLTLLVAFAGIFYLYQFQPQKPDLAQFLAESQFDFKRQLNNYF